MDEWQGPAVYVYNDATFSDADFESISHVGRSGKQDDVAKIGKYGLGFNCAYHFTDVVSFVTRDQLVIFDPHGKSLPGGMLGMRCNFIEKRFRDTYPAQAAPFVWEASHDESSSAFSDVLPCCDPVSLREPLDGTLFRLPLRSAKQAEESAIVNHTFSDDELMGMLQDFAKAANSMLLFLKSVEEIEIYVRHNPGSAQEDEPRQTVGVGKAGDEQVGSVQRLARTWIDMGHEPNTATTCEGVDRSAGANLREMRRRSSQQVEELVNSTNPSERQERQHSCTYELRLRNERAADITETSTGDSTGLQEEKWMLHWTDGHTASDPPSATETAGRAIAQGLGLNEWVAVAVPLSCPCGGKVAEHYAANPTGRAYCFLPLPITTGLHVHIHAAFALSSNRRDLWVAHDAAGAGALKAQWNQHLLEQAVPTCFAEALNVLPDHLISLSGVNSKCQAAVMYSTLPDLELVKPPFEELAARTIHIAAEKDCRVLYDDANRRQPWVPLSEAVFQDVCFARLFALDGNDKIRQLLVGTESMRLVSPPAFVYKSFSKANVSLIVTNPAMVASMLKSRKIKLSRGQAFSVLAYLLEGWRTRKDAFKQLIGLQLAPLHGNSLGTFQARTNCSVFLYLCPLIPLHEPSLAADDSSTTGESSMPVVVDGRALMPKFPLFLDPDAPSDALEALSSKQCLGQLNIVHLSIRGLASQMEYVFPLAWRNTHTPIRLALNSELDEKPTCHADAPSKSAVVVRGKGRNARKRSSGGGGVQQQTAVSGIKSGAEVVERLNLFWAFVDSCGERIDIARSFSGWPIITACQYYQHPTDRADSETASRQSEGQESASYFAMSMDVARSHHALSRTMYTADELYVLDRHGVMFLTQAAERLAVHIQGTEKVSPAVRALVRYFSTESESDITKGVSPTNAIMEETHSEVHSYLRSELRDLILRWSDEEIVSQTPAQASTQGRRKAPRRRRQEQQAQREGMPETVLRQLPIFELIDGRWVSASSSMGAVQALCSPSPAWEELLRIHAPTIPCLSSEGNAGYLLRCAGLEDKNEEEFLGRCIAPWVLHEGASAASEICVAFIEGVERCSRNSSIWKRRQERNPRAMLTALDEAPLVECVDGVRRLVSECMDPDDPDLHVIYGSSNSADLYPIEIYRKPEAIKVLRKAGMSSLGDGESFCKAVEYIARQPRGPNGSPTATAIAAARHLLLYIVGRSSDSKPKLNWSNDHFARVASEEWVPAQDWSRRSLPPDSCLMLSGQQRPPTLQSTDSLGGNESHDDEPWEFVTLPSCIMRSAAPLAWTELVVLDGSADGFGSILASRLRFCRAHPDPEVIATHLSRVTAAMAGGTGSAPTIDINKPENAWRCQAVIQQCSLALAKACKKGSRITRATLTSILGEAPFILVESGNWNDNANDANEFHGSETGTGALPTFVKARHLCLDLEDGGDLGPTARAVPRYLEGARLLLELLGTPSAFDKPKGAPKVAVRTTPPSLGLQQWVRSQFNKPALADVQFVLAAGGIVYAHRLVLANASSYFQQMFLGEMAVSKGIECTGELPVRIELPEWATRESLIMLLSHVYIGGTLDTTDSGSDELDPIPLEKTNPESFEIVLGLLQLSDMMELVFAKEWAEEWLASSEVLDIWNVCTMLVHADACSAHQLRALCVHHIQTSFKLVERTKEWQELPDELKKVVFGRPTEIQEAQDNCKV
jgi:hypothetical protein